MAKILVTGGAGSIGSRVVELFVSDGCEVVPAGDQQIDMTMERAA